MRFWCTALLVIGLSLSGVAQKQNTKPIKVKPSDVDLKKDANAEGKVQHSGGATAPGSANPSKTSKDLQTIERGGAKGAQQSHKPKKTSAALMKPEKEEHTPKINVSGGGNRNGGTQRNTDPYRGRLKQKGQHH